MLTSSERALRRCLKNWNGHPSSGELLSSVYRSVQRDIEIGEEDTSSREREAGTIYYREGPCACRAADSIGFLSISPILHSIIRVPAFHPSNSCFLLRTMVPRAAIGHEGPPAMVPHQTKLGSFFFHYSNSFSPLSAHAFKSPS